MKSSDIARIFVRAVAIASMMVAAVPDARANWLTHILKEAGETGGKAGGHGATHLGPVGKAAAHLKSLPDSPNGALAAHATPEGHWQFVNREGQTFTAGTPDEMGRVLPSLSPGVAATGETKLTLYLSEDSVFMNRAALDALPNGADLNVVTELGAMALTRQGATLKVQLKPNLTQTLADQALFDETLSYLSRQINTSNIRTIAFEPGAPRALSSAPKRDAATKLPVVETVDPAHVAASFRAIRSQTVVVTGRVEDGKLVFAPAKGPEQSLEIGELIEAAAQNDVTLIILKSDTGQQAGNRNWLWQKIEVGGLGDAAKSATHGDFLDALAAKRGGFELIPSQEGYGRIQISAVPSSDNAGVISGATQTLQDAAGHIAGEVVTKAAEIHVRDEASQEEVDARLIPGIPTYVQMPYFVSLVLGLIVWSRVRGWWNRLWPLKAVSDTDGARALAPLRRAMRELEYLLIFTPLVAVPAFIFEVTAQTWATMTAPFRWLRRRFFRREV